jgi:probable HAF family extracellular repeat protein
MRTRVTASHRALINMTMDVGPWRSKEGTMRLNTLLLILSFAVFTTPSIASEEASFVGVGDLPGGTFESCATDVSGDGSVIVGSSRSGDFLEAFRWENGVMVGLGKLRPDDAESQALGVSDDGSVVVGRSASGSHLEAFRWKSGVMEGLGVLPSLEFSTATAVSADGRVVVGFSQSSTAVEAFHWENGVMIGLGDLPGGAFLSQALGVSANGSVVVGSGYSEITFEGFRWENGVMTSLGSLSGVNPFGVATDVSASGSVVVGRASSFGFSGYFPEAFRWENGVMIGLGDLPGGNPESGANGVSADGSVIVGSSATGGTELNPTYSVFIWNAEKGMRDLKEMLVAEFGLDLTGWTLTSAEAVSADGRTIVGCGRNPRGLSEGWIARFVANQTPVATVRADGRVECSIQGGSPVTLDGSASSDPDSTPGTNDDIVLFEWFLDFGLPTQAPLGAGAILHTFLPLGSHNIALRVTDRSGTSSTDQVTVMVVDTTRPQLTLSLSPTLLWPPNHRMVPVQVAWQVSDACDPGAGAVLVSATNNEPDDAQGSGDGNTTEDIQGASIGTQDTMVVLRAERAGEGPGRIYTLTYAATDASGNTASTLGLVTVPHNLGTGPEPVMMSLEEDSTPGVAHLYWNAVIGAEMYDVIQGDVSQVTRSNGKIWLGMVHVLANGQSGTSYSEGSNRVLPPLGNAYFYLAQYRDAQSASGWGTESSSWPAEPVSCDVGCPGEVSTTSGGSSRSSRR